ncbi:MAG: polyprenyl synthetase family protein [Desulfobacteraceae bacterium]|nr:polyprenyl synthetase family protein [Desulfobacteraceae bacterium]
MSGMKQQVLEKINPDLSAIEMALVENLDPHLDLVKQTAGHLIFAGGKRLRPLLIVLCARICGHESPFVTKFATTFEFLHTATLMHDDVIDGANMRRGKQAAHHLYGAPVTVLVGDFLLARAICIAAETENPRIIRVVASLTEQMSEGEIYQLIKKGQTDLTEAEYMDIIRRKTGVLIESACKSGAILAGATQKQENALTAYGKHLGMVFQIADDILDYTADAGELGKNVGADLREGKLTLPVIYALSRAGETDHGRMKAIISNPEFTQNDFAELLDLLEKYQGVADARQKALDHVHKAKVHLEGFAPSATREILEMMADYALKRSS